MSGMPPTLTRTGPALDDAGAPQPVPGSPPAARLRRPGWRDPRMAVGLVLVAVATVVGARLLGTADDTVTVWATADEVRAGDPVTAAALVPSRVRLADGATESTYLPAGAVPGGVFTRDLGAGEILPVGAVGAAGAEATVDLSLAVEAAGAPVDLEAGDLVDVWSVAEPADVGRPGDAAPVLEGVAVQTVRSGTSLGATGRQVVVAVGEDELDVGDALASLAGGTVVLVRVEG